MPKKDILTDTYSNKSNILLRVVQKSDKIFSIYFWKIVDKLACNNRKIADYYEKEIGGQYKKEYEEFGLLKSHKVLHIGCGAYPLTEIILSKSSVLKVVGIDKNPKAIESAKKIIQKRNLEKSVQIIKGNGVNYKLKDFDVIIVSSCSTPMDKIFQNVFNHTNKNTIIIVRTFYSNFDGIFEYINNNENVTSIRGLNFSSFFMTPNFWHAVFSIRK